MEQKMHGFRARLDYILKHNTFINKCFNITVSAFLKVCGIFIPIDKNMVLFSGHSRKYNDSPKAIYEYLIARKEYDNLILVWALEDPENTKLPGRGIKIKADTWTYFKTALKARYWITCVNIERSLHFQKRDQIYLNTWHGVAFNTIGNECNGRKDYDFSNINLFCYESEFNKKHIIKGFNVREDALIPTGLPRNDTLYKTTKEEILELKKKLGLPIDKKIILYAPTWRDSQDNGVTYAIKPPINVNFWENELKNEYILLLRTHAYTNTLLGIEFNDFVRDFSSYPNVNDLFKVADILISDYSSCINDFSILERPIICFAYDYESYKAHRGLNIDFATVMPSGIKKTEQDVIRHIKTMDYEKECDMTKEMLKEKYSNIGGHATEICVEKMFGKV